MIIPLPALLPLTLLVDTVTEYCNPETLLSLTYLQQEYPYYRDTTL